MRPPRTLLALPALLPLAACTDGGERPVRIVVITLDTLRYDSLVGADGGTTMPALAELAGEGTSFTRFYAASATTQPTHATLFTGRHPWQHGVTRNGLVLGEERETLAERLHDAGFETRAVVASFPVSSGFGFAQGFEHYAEDFDHRISMERWHGEELDHGAFFALHERVLAEALAALDAARGPKQFFWFHFFDPHEPYGDTGDEVLQLPLVEALVEARDPRAPAAIAKARRLYDRDVAALDRALGRLFQRLARERDEYETHVVVTSDHGESFGEDGSLGHSKRLTPPQVHVPCVIASPRVAPGVRTEACGTQHLFGTLLAMGGLGTGEDGAFDLTRAGGTAAAFGMRRSAEKPLKDVRTDGTVRMLEGARFFVALGEGLWAGDAERVEDPVSGEPAPERLAADLRLVFARFAAELERADAAERDDPQTRAALEALGYSR